MTGTCDRCRAVRSAVVVIVLTALVVGTFTIPVKALDWKATIQQQQPQSVSISTVYNDGGWNDQQKRQYATETGASWLIGLRAAMTYLGFRLDYGIRDRQVIQRTMQNTNVTDPHTGTTGITE